MLALSLVLADLSEALALNGNTNKVSYFIEPAFPFFNLPGKPSFTQRETETSEYNVQDTKIII